MKLRLIALGAVVATAISALAWSATLRSIEVERSKGRYTLDAETYLEATPEAIFEVLLDYDRFNRISSIYKEHGYLEADDDGTPIVFTRMEGCLMFYCLDMRRVERLETERPGYIRTVTLPEQSDFKYSTSEWELLPEDTGTRMIYRLVMEPDFWIPPVIGPWYIKRTLLKGGGRAINRIERLAQGLPAEDENAT